MSEMTDFDAGLRKMGAGMRHAQAGHRMADEGYERMHAGFDQADAGFIAALEALEATTRARGTLDERFAEMRETIARLEQMLVAQAAEIRALKEPPA
jgi:hypothetical protein